MNLGRIRFSRLAKECKIVFISLINVNTIEREVTLCVVKQLLHRNVEREVFVFCADIKGFVGRGLDGHPKKGGHIRGPLLQRS